MEPSPALPSVPQKSPQSRRQSTPQSPPPRSAPNPLEHLLADRLFLQRERNQLRSRRTVQILDATHLEIAGRRCVNFASNNYLGLTHHPRLISIARMMDEGAGSGAAGLVSGYSESHARAEARIAQWKSTEAAVLLPSGYQANLAAVQTYAALAGDDGRVRFLIDKLAHASLIDAVRASGLPFRVFPHNHLIKLRRLLSNALPGQLQVVVTESIFSMDGDAADLAGLAALKADLPFSLLIDEAHACGVYGNGGAGLLAESGKAALADVIICTFSKAAGGMGGAVCASGLFCEGLINFGRAYIYSTSVPPWAGRAAMTAIDLMHDEPWRQQRVRELAGHVRGRWKAAGVNVPAGDSPIVPVILGDEKETLLAAEQLLSMGIFVTAIRPPTVAPGTARLRFTLSCNHTDQEIEHLMERLLMIIRPAATAGLQPQGP